MTTRPIRLNADTENNPDRTGGSWPTPHQKLLLQAALASGEPALAAWVQWRHEVDIENDVLDLGSFRLLPLVYHNLKQNGASDLWMERLRGIHHQAWVQNQIQFNACVAVLAALHQAGIETLVLKGAALTRDYYPTHGVRPMGDFDVLVPTHQTSQAVVLLGELGWLPTDRPLARLDQAYFEIRHAQNFATPEGRQLDLHWHVLPNAVADSVDHHFWTASVPLSIHQVKTRALNATDLFLHVCVHGATWAPVPPVRWVADAMMILKKAGDQIDWDRLVFMAALCRASLALEATLTYLQETLAAPIPPNLFERLAGNVVSKEERRLFHCQTHRSRLWGLLPVLWWRYQLHLTQHHPKSSVHGWLGFLPYIALYQNVGGLPQMLRWVAAKGAKRLLLKAGLDSNQWLAR